MNEDLGMRFISRAEPPLASGKYTIDAVQELASPSDSPTEYSRDFIVAGKIFSISVADVYSVSPADNSQGDFSNLLPHITFNRKTLPWENICGDSGSPWVALLTFADSETITRDISIAELLKGSPDAYFPGFGLPEFYTDKPEDYCRVVDIPAELFHAVVPDRAERELLAHAKLVDLSSKEDGITGKDGYFSTVIGGRFIPSASGSYLKSTAHLVSMLGYDDVTIVPKTGIIRLVSLYRWDIYSQTTGIESLEEIIKNLSVSAISQSTDSDMLKRGYVPKRHILRTGENTVSLYRGPLVPMNIPDNNADSTATADGALIYDENTGVFDASYSAAWQLGRLLTLSSNIAATAVNKWRRNAESRLNSIQTAQTLNSKFGSEYSPEALVTAVVTALEENETLGN